MSRILFRNCRVWDGSGAPSYPADVLVDGERIRTIATDRGQLDPAGAEIVEANGMTLMPGLVEGHSHITFINAVRATDIGDTPPEEHTLIAARNARILLDHGFTSAYSAASAKLRIDVVIRNAIEAGELPGPRLRACGPEITVTGGLGDDRRPHQFRDSFAVVADGPDEVTKLARLCIREGVDSIKLNISGDDHTRSGALPRTVMSEAEIKAGVTVARDFYRMVNAHCRAAESVKRAVRCGVDVIYHCEHADEEALDMLEAVKDRVFVGPAIGLLHAAVYEAPEGALHTGVRQGIELGLAAAARAYPEMKKRGIRVVIGGDYGFARTPQGENARDIAHFVNHLGYTPTEALICATRSGAQLMGLGNEAGQVREGFLADLLLVDGDPVADVNILRSKDRLVAILKGGDPYKLDRSALQHPQMRAAE
ncbi:amidohydrolase family protein [Actinacidiphila oryziradicis]|uniref:metal-dependent hydrolase family protein n=1 Tax=Actinacidiphila oryziradicis TaxID=2571141 RepID=UPI0023F249C3|nr:amidohydrolase family protein [Actinacidiphila oryziradicis]MCW2869497.1 amidohydrolase [Actinacidiphila oryziradicis]